ncbi:MAG: hypothetical protein AAFX93_11740 [Verrucomicrobiota bacterium]
MSDKFVKNILDVPGVEGVCVFDQEGRLIVNELPSFFVEELFDDLSRRALSLYETVDENFVPCDDYLLKYSERWIFLRRSNGVFLLVLALSTVNRVSLKMVSNLALKHIKPSKLGSAPKPIASKPLTPPGNPPPAATPVQEPSPQPAAPAEPAQEEAETEPAARKRAVRPRPKRSYRGSNY